MDPETHEKVEINQKVTRAGTGLKIMVAALAAALLAGCTQSPATPDSLVLATYYDRAKQRKRVVESPPVLGELITLPDGRFAARDRLLQEKATAAALSVAPAGIPTRWHNAETGLGGTITPIYTYRNGRHQYCRTFEEAVVADDLQVERTAKACRRPDGPWHVKPLL